MLDQADNEYINEEDRVMKFNSQICTTKEQSERLLALGLKRETADCIWCEVRTLSKDNPIQWHLLPEYIDKYDEKHIPAWSLHRLIELLNYQVIHNDNKYEPVIALDGMAYQDVCSDDPIVGWSGDLYTDVIDCIKWLISIEQFNKEYLEE